MITIEDEELTPEELEQERQNKISRVKNIMEDRGISEADAYMVEDLGYHASSEVIEGIRRVVERAPPHLAPYVMQHALLLTGRNCQMSWVVNEQILDQDDCDCLVCRTRRFFMGREKVQGNA